MRYIHRKHCAVYPRYAWLSNAQLYLASYLFILTYGKVTESAKLMSIIHFATSFVAPVASVVGIFSKYIFGFKYDSAYFRPVRRLCR